MEVIKSIKNNIGAAMVGWWTTAMFTLNLNYALKQAFGININHAFSPLASIYENVIMFVSSFICVSFGVFIACYIKREKYWGAGILTICFNMFITLLFLVIFIIVKTVPTWFYGFIFVQTIGGLAGIYVYKYILKVSSRSFEGDVYDYLNFYFAPKGWTFFSVIILFTAVHGIVVKIPTMILFIKWLFIAPAYVLLHPNLWLGSMFSDTGQFMFSPFILFLAPLALFYLTYKIGTSSRNKLKKISLILLLFVAYTFLSGIAEGMVRGPIERSVERFASKGNKVWGVLLDRYTRPMEKEIRYNQLIKSGNVYEAEELLEATVDGYFDLAFQGLKGENLDIAEESFESILQLSENDINVENIAVMYYEFEIYYKAVELFEALYGRDPQNLDVIDYLGICYYELDMNEEMIPLLKAKYDLIKNDISSEEGKVILETIAYMEQDLAEADETVEQELNEN